MKRRNLLQALVVGAGVGAGWFLWRSWPKQQPPITVADNKLDQQQIIQHETHVLDQLVKSRRFDDDFHDDIYLTKTQIPVFQSAFRRMDKIQALVGYANFALLGFDEMLSFARAYPRVEPFTVAEKSFLEEIFFHNAREYGFNGKKVITDLTARVDKRETIKIPGTGQFLFKGDALHTYTKLRKEVGDDLILTSGVRSVVKQLYLFLNKLAEADGNLSRASRSLAPPGHSYHGIGDFDVGKRGLGKLNFTQEFSHTAEFKKLIALDYIDIRYTDGNHFGVRYEPWHIKVV